MGVSQQEQQAARERWVQAGYPSDMGSAIAARPPKDKSLRRLYHLTTAEFAASDLWFARLKVATLNELNDPFEFLAATHRKRDGSYTRALKDKAEAAKQVGLLCFSEDWTSPAMWAHYGAKHAGVCLGFDVPLALLIRVEYRAKRVEAAQTGGPSPLVVPLEEHLRIKANDWQYEREWRRIVQLSDADQHGGLHFVPFGADLRLAEVILGERCGLPLHSMRERATSQYPDAVVFRARIARQHFSVVPDEDTIMAPLQPLASG